MVGGFLNGKNQLSVTEVIFQQFIKGERDRGGWGGGGGAGGLSESVKKKNSFFQRLYEALEISDK